MKICDFTTPELEVIKSECNFTEEEMAIFDCLARGMTIERTSEESCYSDSTVKRIKKRIWSKIDRIMSC